MNPDSNPDPAPTARVEVTHFDPTGPGRPESRVVIEERPLAIEVLGADKFTIMRTPGHDRELAIGFLLSEGMIDTLDDVLAQGPCPRDSDLFRVRVADPKRRQLRRNLVINSSCGLCGRVDVEGLVNEIGKLPNGIQVSREILCRLPDEMKKQQRLFAETGGSHAAALFDRRGEIRILHEDLGRHNALDKVLGAALLAGASLGDCGVMLSGRASLEMIIKAARGRIALVAAVSAPSARAVEVADGFGMTLCGFVRGDDFVVYSHPGRIGE